MSDPMIPPNLRRRVFGFQTVFAEAGAVLRQLTRTRALAVWLAVAVVWPLVYVAALGNVGPTPLYLMMSLSAFPIGPILACLVGASVAARKGSEFRMVWPAPAGVRAIGLALVLVPTSAVLALAMTAATLWHVSPAFWAPAGFALFSLWTGAATLFTTYGLWMAVGVAVGARTREPWRTVGAVLVPALVLVIAALTNTFQPVGLVRFISISPPAAWFLDQSGAFGLGPAAALHGPVLLGTLAMLVVALAFAGLASYGRHLLSALAGAVGTSIVLVLALGQGLWAAPAEPFGLAASAYHRRAPSPVAVRSVTIDLSLRQAPDVTGTVQTTVVPTRSVSQLRAFLIPALRLGRVTIGGVPTKWERLGRAGWLRLLPTHRLPAGRAVDVIVTYRGRGNLLAIPPENNTPAMFVSGQGWQLPAGTWYPLIGHASPMTEWKLALGAPPGYLTVTPFGTVRGSTRSGHPVTGRGMSVALVGGHLAPAGRVGRLTVFAAADQISLARQTLHGTMPGLTPGERHTASCLANVLVPAPMGRIVWATSAGSIEMVSGPDDPPWQGRNDVQNALVDTGMGIGLGPRFTYPAEFNENFSQSVIGLWLTDGRRARFPVGNGPASVLTGGIVKACTGFYGNGTLVSPVTTAIGKLPYPALRYVTAGVYRADSKGHLTLTVLKRLLHAAQVRYGESRTGS